MLYLLVTLFTIIEGIKAIRLHGSKRLVISTIHYISSVYTEYTY